jgi:hypothetical protein
MGNPYQPRNLTITGDHHLTEGYVGTNLSTVGWLDKIQPQHTYDILAYAHDLLPTKEIETYPAMTLSYYNHSRVIFFAADIGLSSYEGHNASVWLNITRRALLWSLQPCEEVSSINANKEVKTQGSGKSAKTHVTIDIYSSGNLPAETVFINETFSKDFTIDSTDGNVDGSGIWWDLGSLAPRTSWSLEYVLLNPDVTETTIYPLTTRITYGNETIEFISNVTIEAKGGKK